MPKEQTISLKGKVIEVLPNAHFKVILYNNQHNSEILNLDEQEKGSEQQHIIMAHSSGKIRKHRIKILLHDNVTVEMTPYDLGKGRITHREK